MKITLIFLASLITGVMVISFSIKRTEPTEAPRTTIEKIKLVPAETTGGMPLMEALKKRQSERIYSSRKLDDQTLSNLLWAAFGISREESGKRTAPTANNTQAMDVYVILETGAYKYLAEEHLLEQVSGKDLRTLAGKQDFVYTAPVNLVYVSDYSKLKSGSDKEIYSGAHAGFIGENVYLYCASAGLNTVIRAWVDKEPLSKELNLNENQKIVLAQTVGYGE
ncbi:MAG: nitroreductase family protein [Candidatus Kapaibacterium sp.]